MKQSNAESGSSIGTWLVCPKKYEYAYVKGFRSPPTEALNFGSEIHRYVELANSGMNVEPESKEAKIVIKWSDYWRRSNSQYSTKNLEFLDVEGEWKIDVNGKELVGKRDGYIKHKSGKCFLYELKTATAREQDQYIRLLESNDQINNNVLALQQEGKQVDGTIYDIIWKPLIRQKKAETEEDFTQRFVDEFDDGDKCFTRLVVLRKKETLENHYKELSIIMSAMKTTPVFRNTTGCRHYNRLCPYFDACMEDNDDMLEGFEKKTKKHSELSEEIQ